MIDVSRFTPIGQLNAKDHKSLVCVASAFLKVVWNKLKYPLDQFIWIIRFKCAARKRGFLHHINKFL